MPKKSRATPAIASIKSAFDGVLAANPHLQATCREAMTVANRGVLAQAATWNNPTGAGAVSLAAFRANAATGTSVRFGAAGLNPSALAASAIFKSSGHDDATRMGALTAAYRESMTIATAGQHMSRLSDAFRSGGGYTALRDTAATTIGTVSATAARENWHGTAFGGLLKAHAGQTSIGEWAKSVGIANGRMTICQFMGLDATGNDSTFARVLGKTHPSPIPMPTSVPVERLIRIPDVALRRPEPVEEPVTLGSVEENAVMAWARRDTVHVSPLGSDQILWGEMIASIEAIGWVLDRTDYHRDNRDQLHAIILWRMAVDE